MQNKDSVNWKKYTVKRWRSNTQEAASINIQCPFCQSKLTIERKKMSGSGYPCDCGAIIGSSGLAYRARKTLNSKVN